MKQKKKTRNEIANKYTLRMSDFYIRALLRSQGNYEPTKKQIEEKKKALAYKRSLKELKLKLGAHGVLAIETLKSRGIMNITEEKILKEIRRVARSF